MTMRTRGNSNRVQDTGLSVWRTEGLGASVFLYLVPAAVMLGGRTVVLQHLGDGALIDALKVQLPLPKFQETPETEKQEAMLFPPITGPEGEQQTARSILKTSDIYSCFQEATDA